MTIHRTFCLLLASASLLAGCSQGPTESQADMQERLTAAEARATAAEKRAKNAETMAQQHVQEAPFHEQPVGQPEIAEGNNDFGQPMNDARPIEPAPASIPNGPPQQ